MSHLVTIPSRVTNVTAAAAACRRLDLAAPVNGTAKLYGGDATGLLVQLKGWRYPVVIDTQSGAATYDHFGGAWGDEAQLHRFLQIYAVELVRLQARQRGLAVMEQAQADGSIRLQIQDG